MSGSEPPRRTISETTRVASSAEAGEIEAVYLLGADEIDMARLGQAFVIYQGHHGDDRYEPPETIDRAWRWVAVG